MQLASQIEKVLHHHNLERTAGVIAISGGPDSVALAHLCVELLSETKIARLLLAHVNHQLRGAESDADEAFVQQLAQDVGVPCKTTRIDMAAIAERERDNLESTARRERYAWLTQVARDENAAWIATGHTADDQAETVLFRLLRGSGVGGLAGMAECRPLADGLALIRPFLSVRRKALHDYLEERQFAFRIDSSNRDLRFTRNRLRLELLPVLEEQYNSGVVDVLCRLAEQAQELRAVLIAQADELIAVAELPRAGAILVFSLDRLQIKSTNLLREMFRRVWLREGWPMGHMDFDRWNSLAEIVAGSRSACDCPGGIHVKRIGKVVQVHAPTWRV